MAKFCAWCGKQIDDDDVFCAFCGKRADGSDAPAPAETPAAPAAPVPPQQPQWQAPQQQPPQPQQSQWQQPPQQWQQPPQQPQWQQPAPQKKGKGGLIAGIVAVVLVAAVVVGGFVWPGFFKKDKGGEVPEKPGTAQATEKPAATKAPKATDAPKETLGPKPMATPEPTPDPTPEPTPYQNPFTDVKADDWYYDAVMWAGENGIVSGTEFKPKGEATRAQAITFLWRAAGEPEPGLKVSPYTDVKETDFFHDPVLWGFENGLVSTAKDAQFHPTDTLTRATALTFISRAVDGKAKGAERSFVDVPEGKWYFDVANWALENGVVGRDDSWTFKPDDTVTRAQFITFMHRAMDPAAKKASADPPGKQSFQALGITENVDDHGQKSFNTYAERKDNNEVEDVTFSAQVTSYRVFEEDDAFPKFDGYEYRIMTVQVVTKNADYARLYHAYPFSADYYNVKLYEDSAVEDDNGMETHTVIHNGVPTECTIWDRSEYESRDGYFYVDFTWTASVPKGYDGLVVGLYNSSLSTSGLYLNEYYLNDNDFAMFRMN